MLQIYGFLLQIYGFTSTDLWSVATEIWCRPQGTLVVATDLWSRILRRIRGFDLLQIYGSGWGRPVLLQKYGPAGFATDLWCRTQGVVLLRIYGRQRCVPLRLHLLYGEAFSKYATCPAQVAESLMDQQRSIAVKAEGTSVVTKANALIEASYNLTLNEQRIILACAAKVDGRKPMPREAVFVLDVDEFVELFGSDPKNAYAEMEEAASKLYVIQQHSHLFQQLFG